MKFQFRRVISICVIAVGVSILAVTTFIGLPQAKPANAKQKRTVVQLRVVQHSQERTYTLILVPVFINSHGPYQCLFDTGCPNCILASDMAAKVGLVSTPTGQSAAMFGMIQPVQAGVAQSVSIGSASVAHVPISVQDFTSIRTSMDDHYDGIIGYDYIRHFRTTLDFAKGQLIFESQN